MRKSIQNIVLAVLLLLHPDIKAQVIFKTIVPQEPVVVGESFPIQYVLEDVEKDDGFTPPVFTGFRLVSGPNMYKGSLNSADGSKTLKNIVFTLVAIKPGNFVIPGAFAKVNGRFIKSDDALVRVVSNTTSFEKNSKDRIAPAASEYFLQPGEDPYEKMRKNLFMKVMVDRKSCYVGQPVTATFKLYSRLESKSDIVKNPGFYGFTVQDIVGLNDNISSTEKINGKPFDVHTVRIVQLYPLRAGMFIIDAMEVMNRVEFSKSAVGKKTEQEISEGVHENNDPPAVNNNTVTYKNNISTEKISILVKPYPEKNQPELFGSATGSFNIIAEAEKSEIARNEESFFVITLRGKGNFTQLPAPAVQWPAGIEAFDPVIKDSLDKSQAPLKGSRTFCYTFISGKAGDYIIPAISFSFFDPDSNKYKTVSTQPATIKISQEEVKKTSAIPETKVPEKNNYSLIWITGSVFLLILTFIFTWLKKIRNQKPKQEMFLAETGTRVSANQLLQPAQFSLIADDGRFYSLLQKGVWDYLRLKLELSGSKMNKHDLYNAMKEKKLDEAVCRNILDVLQQCEASMFTQAEFVHNKEELLNVARAALEQLPG